MDGVLKTPFGVTTVDKLSTGCKAVLIYFWLIDMDRNDELVSLVRHPLDSLVLNLTECGANAILYLFRAIGFNEDSLSFLLEHNSGIIIEDSERNNFRINGKIRGGLVL